MMVACCNKEQVMSETDPTPYVHCAGGFIGSHMVKRLKKEGFWIGGVDLKYPGFSGT